MWLKIFQGLPGPKGKQGLTLGIEKVIINLKELCSYNFTIG